MDYKIVLPHPGGVAIIPSRFMLATDTPEKSVKSYEPGPLGLKGVPIICHRPICVKIFSSVRRDHNHERDMNKPKRKGAGGAAVLGNLMAWVGGGGVGLKRVQCFSLEVHRRLIFRALSLSRSKKNTSVYRLLSMRSVWHCTTLWLRQTKNLANIQPYLPQAWSINNVYGYVRLCKMKGDLYYCM